MFSKVTDQLDARRWRRGFLAWGTVAALVALGLGWTVLWFVASRAALNRLDDWVTREAAQGRVWSCPERRIEGFPASLFLVCDEPTFAGPVEGATIHAGLARLSAGASLLAPRHVDIEFGGPLALATTDESVKLSLVFQRLRLELQLSLEKLQRAALLGDDADIHLTVPNAMIDGRARSVELAAQPLENVDGAYDIRVRGSGLAFPDLDRFAASTEPAELSVDARLASAPALSAGRGVERLENWRLAHGRLSIERLAFGKGALEVTGSGELGLDQFHRLEGRAEVGERGADAILLRLGVPPAAIGVANALSGLLRGPERGRPMVKLPLSFRDGRVAIGPLRNVFPLKPLY